MKYFFVFMFLFSGPLYAEMAIQTAKGKVLYFLKANEAVSEVEIKRLSFQSVDPFKSYLSEGDCRQEEKDQSKSYAADPGTIIKIINMGLKLWKLIEANRPILNFQGKMANALPNKVSCWDELSDWQVPKSAIYEVTYKNLFGVEVSKLKVRLTFSYGGKFQNKGAYLANISLRPVEVSAAWGYRLNADVEIPQVLNVSSNEDPVAGAQVFLNWSIETALKKSQNSFGFFIDGTGHLKEL